MSAEDFPAAHSMDTEWFAVDSEGNVARFLTGEAGATPNSSQYYVDEPPTVAELMNMLGDQVEYDVEDLLAMQGGPVFDYTWQTLRYITASFSDADSCYHLLMKLPQSAADPAQFDNLFSNLAGRAADQPSFMRLPNKRHVLAYTEGPVPVSSLQRWIERGEVEKAWVNHTLSASRIGIYEYEHGAMFENWIAGLYLRDSVPAQPLSLAQLPETLQPLFAATRFHLRSFARDAAIDPREAGDCINWESAWVGFDGIVHRPDEFGGDGGDEQEDEE